MGEISGNHRRFTSAVQYLRLFIFLTLLPFEYFVFIHFCRDPFYLSRDSLKGLDPQFEKTLVYYIHIVVL